MQVPGILVKSNVHLNMTWMHAFPVQELLLEEAGLDIAALRRLSRWGAMAPQIGAKMNAELRRRTTGSMALPSRLSTRSSSGAAADGGHDGASSAGSKSTGPRCAGFLMYGRLHDSCRAACDGVTSKWSSSGRSSGSSTLGLGRSLRQQHMHGD